MTRQKVLRWLVWVQIAAAILVPALPVPAQTCPNGTLLFKEDFGGNSVDDPHISTTPITAMDKAYKQNTSVKYSMSSGRYLVTKKGYANGDTTSSSPYSQWYIQTTTPIRTIIHAVIFCKWTEKMAHTPSTAPN